MRIAQIAPLYESVPPKLYGGTERVVAYLTDLLVEDGHEVTLFASQDSVTKAKLFSISPESLRLSDIKDPLAYHLLEIEEVYKRAADFDIIHNHNEYLAYSLARRTTIPTVSTLHGRLDTPELLSLYREFSEVNLISISQSQRAPLPFVNWVGNVYHGLPLHLYDYNSNPEGYLAFVGRLSPEKNVESAIHIAKQAKIHLKIAAKIDESNKEYFTEVITPLLEDPLIEYIGEIDEKNKSQFLGKARAFLFPIDWCEPFGLVMIEALACGPL